jgi:hypothetical protein
MTSETLKLETLKKEFVKFNYNKNRKTWQHREALIATQFALDDMMNEYNQYKRNVSEEYALGMFNEEIRFLSEKYADEIKLCKESKGIR